MDREIIRCLNCNGIVGRNSWVQQELTSLNILKTEFFCRRCQKSFPLDISAEPPKGWHITGDGYIMIKVPGVGWVREHTFIWEKEHGKLPEHYVIHHINGDKTDNRLENLIGIHKSKHAPSSPTGMVNII